MHKGLIALSRPAAAFAWLLTASWATAATYHVAPSGKDTNGGGPSAPWATLQHAAGKVAPGDTVVVKAGRYAGFDLRRPGAKGLPITFRAEKGAVIDARNPRTPDGINLENSGHVVLDGFVVEKLPRAGIRVVHSAHVTIRNNVIDGCGIWGILTGFADDLLIENNVTSRAVQEHGIYVGNTCNGPVVRGNTIWGNPGCGIHLNGDKSAGGAGIITRAIIENNTIYDNGRRVGSGINCDGLQDSVIQNNLLYHNHASGISLYRICGGEPSKNNLVINNTVVMAPDGRWALNIQNGSTKNVVLNNILLNRHSFRGSLDISPDCCEGFRCDYNVLTDRFSTDGGETIFNLARWRETHGQDKHSIVALPEAVFKDVEANDYHLSPTSPAVDAGTTEKAPRSDREGKPRPRGNGVDIGAYESAEAASAPSAVPPPRGPAVPTDKAAAPRAAAKVEKQAWSKASLPTGGWQTSKRLAQKDASMPSDGLGGATIGLLVVGVAVVFGGGTGLALLLLKRSSSRRRRIRGLGKRGA